jgi:hypothetical protein
MSTVRIGVEPTFEGSDWAWGRNVQAAQEWLDLALEDAASQYRFALTHAIRSRLFNPPMTLQNFSLEQRFSGGPTPLGMPWVKDAGLALLCATSALPDVTKWEDLSKAQRRKAEALSKSFLSTNRVSQKGRSIDTDVPLLIYLIYAIEEIIGEPLPMSRPKCELAGQLVGKVPPRGPAFMLLYAAYAQASVKLQVMPSGKETVYRVARLARSAKRTRSGIFKRKLLELMSQYSLKNYHYWIGIDPSDSTDLSDAPYSNLLEFIECHPGECSRLFTGIRARNR